MPGEFFSDLHKEELQKYAEEILNARNDVQLASLVSAIFVSFIRHALNDPNRRVIIEHISRGEWTQAEMVLNGVDMSNLPEVDAAVGNDTVNNAEALKNFNGVPSTFQCVLAVALYMQTELNSGKPYGTPGIPNMQSIMQIANLEKEDACAKIAEHPEIMQQLATTFAATKNIPWIRADAIYEEEPGQSG